MNPIQYIEIPADNVKRAVEFYSNLFEWKAKEFRGEKASCGAYYHMQTSQDSEGMGAGIMQRQTKEHFPTAYITVDSVDAFEKKIKESGGSICFPKMAVPKMGWFLCFMDTEKNVFALWQDDKEAEFTEEQKKEMEKYSKQGKDCSCSEKDCSC